MEIWKKLERFPKYEVSNFGRVRNIKRGTIRKLSTTYSGYRRIGLTGKGGHVSLAVHRLVAFAFLEPSLNQAEVNHKDGNKSNNRADNLEWCTRSENLLHRSRTLTCFNGELVASSKLTEVQVMEIRQRGSVGERLQTIAKDYDVATATIHKIISGETWYHLPTIKMSRERDRYTKMPKYDHGEIERLARTGLHTTRQISDMTSTPINTVLRVLKGVGIVLGGKRLSPAIKQQIRDTYAAGNTTFLELAQKHGVAKSLIHRIVHTQ